MRLFLFAAFTMAMFAANSLLCRLALVNAGMDAQSFTFLRVTSGACVLLLLTSARLKTRKTFGSFKAAAALFTYMACFSLAYTGLGAATGTLIMVVSILVSTLFAARVMGEPMAKRQFLGVGITLGGLLVLLGPALSRPPLKESLLMACAGAAWAGYSILGRKSVDPALDTTGNFVRCLPFALLLLPFLHDMPLPGIALAVASGAFASALGYVLWYRLVGLLSTLTAALVQLSMPVLTALGAWFLLGEGMTIWLAISGCIILFGIGYVQVSGYRSLPISSRPR